MTCPDIEEYLCFTYNETYLKTVQKLLDDEKNPWIAGKTAFYNGFIATPLAAGERLSREGVLKDIGTRKLKPAAAAARPSSVNLATASDGAFVSAVQYQGFCGSCTAFGVTAAMETFARIHDADRHADLKLSEANLFFAGAGENCWCGWDTRAAVEFASKEFIVSEKAFPYRAYNQLPDIPADAPGVRIKAFDVATSIDEMKDHLAENRPLIAVIDFNPDLFLYFGGVYRALNYPHPTSTSPILNIHAAMEEAATSGFKHCLCCVGYDDEKAAWLCKNSFGTTWGCEPGGNTDDTLGGGYIWIGYEEYGINHLMYAITDVEFRD